MNETKEQLSYKEPSILNTLSYGSAGFWNSLAYGVFNAYLMFFYESVVGLNIVYVFWAMLIFTVWDAINDPLAFLRALSVRNLSGKSASILTKASVVRESNK